MVRSTVYGDSFGGYHDESIGKPNENKNVKKQNVDVNWEKLEVNNMTMRPKENPYNQSEIGYQSVNTTINNMSSISGYFTLTPLLLIFSF